MIERAIKISQFQKESEAWKRSLAFLLQENAYLKLRLGELVNNNTENGEFLEAIEHYQNRFLRKDEILRLIQQDLSQLDQMLLRDLDQDEAALKDVQFRQKKYRKEIRSLESAFNKLKVQFNNFLSETL